MGLRKFLTIIAVFLALLIIISSALLIVSTTRLYKNISRVAEAVENIHTATQLEIKLLTHNRESFLWYTNKKQEHYDKKKEEEIALFSLLDKSKRSTRSSAEREIVTRLEHVITDYFASRQDLEIKRVPPMEIYNRVPETLDNIFLLIDELIKLNRQKAERLEAETRRQDRFANVMGISIAISALLIIITFLILVKHFLYNPIMKVRDAINKFTISDFTIKAPEKGPKEIREIARTFNTMAERLAKQREAQHRFLAAIAHDLKNPISAIALSSQLLIEQEVRSETKNMIDVIQRQAKRLNRMVGDLLDTSRIEAGKLELQKKRENITHIVDDAVGLYRSTSQVHRINLKVPENPIYSVLDSVRMSQVINNLLSNAIKYSPQGGTIDVEIFQQDSEVIISVSDEGIGISKEEKEHIFEPFKRTTKTRASIPGVGLGLSVAKRIIEAHGGKITIKSQVNKGSTFFIHLPYHQINQ